MQEVERARVSCVLYVSRPVVLTGVSRQISIRGIGTTKFYGSFLVRTGLVPSLGFLASEVSRGCGRGPATALRDFFPLCYH